MVGGGEVVAEVEAAVGGGGGGGGGGGRRRRRRRRPGRRRNLRVVDVGLGCRAGVLTRVRPGEMSTILAVDAQPHAVAEEARLERIVVGDQIRHRVCRHARVAVRRR